MIHSLDYTENSELAKSAADVLKEYFSTPTTEITAQLKEKAQLASDVLSALADWSDE